MIYFIFFICGILFSEFILPIITCLTETIALKFEKIKGRIAVDIAKMNKEVNDMANPPEEPHRVIGFQVQSC